MKSSLVNTLAAALSATVIVAGCTSTHEPSKAKPTQANDIVTRASAVCAKSNSALASAAQKAFSASHPTPSSWRSFMINTGLPIIQHRFDDIVALNPTTFADLHQAAATAISTAKEHPEVMSPQTSTPFEHVNSILSTRGLRACTVGT